MASFDPSFCRLNEQDQEPTSSKSTHNQTLDNTIPRITKSCLKKATQGVKSTSQHPIYLTALSPFNHTSLRNFLNEFYSSKGLSVEEINNLFNIDSNNEIIINEKITDTKLENLERELLYLKCAWDLKSLQPLNLLQETQSIPSRHISFKLDPSIVEENKPRPRPRMHEEAEDEAIYLYDSYVPVGVITQQLKDETSIQNEQLALKYIAQLLNSSKYDRNFALGKIQDRLDPDSAIEFDSFIYKLRSRKNRILSEEEITYLKNVYKFTRLYGKKIEGISTSQSL